MTTQRSSGLLMHVSSLPSRFGIGDLGPQAYAFANACAASMQQYWQVLPVCPVGLGYSPYASPASFAGNPWLISPDQLVRDGWLTPDDLGTPPAGPPDRVDFRVVGKYKQELLTRAFLQFLKWNWSSDFHEFVDTHQTWLFPYATHCAARKRNGHAPWPEWAEADRTQAASQPPGPDGYFYLFEQYVFDQQWQALRAHCHERGVKIVGDLPIYVAHDSADVWAHPDQFHLDSDGQPTVVAGVPPDFFSATGQRWGNPIYRWDVMARDGFSWWMRRLRRALDLYDLVRLDHFRGFAGYWEIPAHLPTAETGRWVTGPGQAFFDQMRQSFGHLPIFAEDLGVITPDVEELLQVNGFSGMAVLQFAFDSGNENPHLPHHYRANQFAFTGTHDNDTFLGWWTSAPAREKAFAREYLGIRDGNEVCPKAIERCMHSEAGTVILPVQDVLALGTEARMNLPGMQEGNWAWRLRPHQMESLFREAVPWLRAATAASGRTGTA